jgi:hypothetical protein
VYCEAKSGLFFAVREANLAQRNAIVISEKLQSGKQDPATSLCDGPLMA